ncbi:XRE family transcriptional regulator [Taibaiella koreensis]|uniref:XRE family transcriptional regulator n=1 Tax=Taibaiella koreensis TaxID=1268548 RepID=UPI000E59FFB7|nr:helix-turn-helix domain-containing protein [Taibaiella koreensis]
MNNQKVFFSVNIKFLRERKKLSQEALANQLAFTRSKLAAIESGATKAPQPEDLIMISEFFKISVDSLLKVDLGKLGGLKMRELEAGNDVYMTGSKIRVLAITVDKDNKENLEYVPVRAKAGYRAGYNDPEFIATLPKFSMPNLQGKGTFRMFPTTGDSMLPIPENSEVIAQYIEDWKAIKPDTPCIVILKGDQEFVFKQVTVQNDGTLLLKSLNDLFAPYTVQISEVLEIWKYYKHQTNVLPEKPTEVQEIKVMIDQVLQELKKK